MSKRVKKTDINGWKEEEEYILKKWADNAICFHWLHNNSYRRYKRLYALFTIPVIIISTLTGTGNFAVERFGPDVQNVAIMIIGAFNIIAAIISTIQQFLKISEISEGHRVASTAWDKFGRNLGVELAKNPVDRKPASDILKLYKEEYDRLMETSPKFSQKILDEFNSTFKEKNLIKPDITGNVNETTIFDRKKIEWEEIPTNVNDNMDEKIESYKREYFESNGRFPNEFEIKSHFNLNNLEIIIPDKDESDKIVNVLDSYSAKRIDND
jgi:hypothetical protein